MLYKLNKIKWSHQVTLTIDNITTNNKLSCNNFKILKLIKENCKISCI